MRKRQRESIVEECRDRLEDAWNQDRENREDALLDLKMLAGEQWPEHIKQQREREGRPVLRINKLPQFVHQVSNDVRQNPPGIKVSPAGGGTDPELADIYTGLIRHIEYQSNAADIYAQAAGHAVACGIGHFRVTTGYAGEDTFDQEIYLKRIPHPLSVLWDPASVEPDRCDAEWCIVSELVHRETFEMRWPKNNPASFEIPLSDTDPEAGTFWRNGDFIRLAEYWRKKPMKRKVVQVASGAVIDVTGLSRNELTILNMEQQILLERDIDSYRVEHCLLSAMDMLEPVTEWIGRYIPIVPVIGGEVPLDTKIMRYGLIRFARDPQQLYNFARSAAAESIALAPKAPLAVTPKQIGKFKTMWDTHNITQRPYLLYEPDERAPGAPQRIMPPDVPMALIQEAQTASEDMKATTGIYDASLGARSNETSGKAILARQREGDVSTAHFTSNLNVSVRRAGQILVDLIPKVYDTERQVRILGEDETEDYVPINTVVMSDDGVPVLKNDLSQGRYDVRLRVGPNYTTKRLEAADSIMAFIQAVPNAAPIIADLIAKNQDWPGSDEIAERLKRMVPPQALGPEEQEQPDPMQQQMMQMQAAMQEMGVKLEMALKDAQVKKTEADTQKSLADAQETKVDTMIKLLQAHLGQDPMNRNAPTPRGAEASAGKKTAKSSPGLPQ